MTVDTSKEARIKREKTRLKKLLADVDSDCLKLVDKLVGNVAFMAVELEDLQETISIDGWTSEYKNGENQWGTKKSPEAEVYTSLMQRQLAAVKQLLDLRPDDGPKKPKDPLLDFVNGR